jgi:hypothetical protein
MSVPSTDSRIPYILTSGTQTVAVPFYFLDEEHLKVLKTVSGVSSVLTLGTDYSVSGAGDEAGGSITFTGAATSAGNAITIKRSVPITQLVDYVYNDRFPAETHERALDKLTMICQSLQDQADRALRFGEGEMLDGTLSLAARKGKGVSFNATTGAVEFFDVTDLFDAAEDAIAAAAAAASYQAKIEVATIADLRALGTGAFEAEWVAQVNGYHFAGDGGGGQFRFFVGIAGVDNGGTIIHSADLGGTWLRITDNGINVRQFGARGDGVTDDAAAITAATNWADGQDVFFPKGVYRVRSQLALTVFRYSWIGEGHNRGTNAFPRAPYYSTEVNFDPVVTTEYMVFRSDPSPFYSEVRGPFSHRGIAFVTSNERLFRFGDETLGVVADGSGEKYIFGVRFDGCSFQSTVLTTGTRNGSGVVNNGNGFTGRYMIWATKCFDSYISDCAFRDGEVQVRIFGCDKFTMSACRMQMARKTQIECVGSGTFDVQHVFDKIQFENWGFLGLFVEGCTASLSNSSFESSVGLVSLGTANIAENGTSFVASSTMVNKLIPGYSVVKITSGTRVYWARVASVSGSTVTLHDTVFTVTNAAATLETFDGIGILLGAEVSFNASNIGAGGGINSPFVAASMFPRHCSFVNVGGPAGSYLNKASVILGNASLKGASIYSGTRIKTTNFSPVFAFDAAHPMIDCMDYGADYTSLNGVGSYQSLQDRWATGASAPYALRFMRKWTFGPFFGMRNVNNHLGILELVDVDSLNTLQSSVYSVRLKAGVTGQADVLFQDDTLPNVAGARFKLTAWLASPDSGVAGFVAQGNGGSSIGTVTVDSATLKPFVFIAPPGSSWEGAATVARSLQVVANSGTVFVAAVVVEPLVEADAILSNSTSLSYRRAFSGSGNSADTIEVLRLPSSLVFNNGSGFLDLYANIASAGGEQAYGTAMARAQVSFGKSFDTTHAAVSATVVQQSSVNAGVINVTAAFTVAVVSNDVVVSITLTRAGSNPGVALTFVGYADVLFPVYPVSSY